ncbi:MAG: T9SS type A sorting domain-containing protein [Flavobacteriales bacterium]
MKARIFLLIFFIARMGYSQVLENPCINFPGCQSTIRNGVVHSNLSILTTKQKYNLLVGAGDTISGQIDTTFTGTVNLTLLSGPGTFVGSANKYFLKYTYLDLKFYTPGNYKLEIEIVGVGKDVIDFIVYDDDFTAMCNDYSKGCVSGGGSKILLKGPNVIIVDVMFPFNVLVLNPEGKIDITYAGVVTLKKLSGPGNFTGNLSLYGEQRVSFNDLKFDQVGLYTVEVDVENIGKDTAELKAEADNSIKTLTAGKATTYPNPTSGTASIKLPSESEYINTINVFNALGEKVKSIPVNLEIGSGSFQVDLNSLSEGSYWMAIISQEHSYYASLVVLK